MSGMCSIMNVLDYKHRPLEKGVLCLMCVENHFKIDRHLKKRDYSPNSAKCLFNYLIQNDEHCSFVESKLKL